jgi:ABC-type transport system involved in multi-copper enzyme maturation permease subunit
MTRLRKQNRPAGFGRVLLSEWTKLRTVRSTRWLPVAMLGVVPAMAVFVAVTSSLQPDDTILGGSLTGAVLAQMIAGIFGVLVMSGEYGTGMIRVSFAARPQRIVVVCGKAVVAAAVTFTVALPAGWVAYLIGTALLSGRGYATGEPMPALLGVAVNVAAVAVLGVAVGALLRHSAAAVTVVLAVIVLPGLFGPLFGDLQRWVAGASPTASLQKLSQTSDATATAVGGLPAWSSLWLVCAYIAAVLAVAAVHVDRRDA